MTFLDQKGRRVGSHVRVRVVGRTAVVVFAGALAAAMAFLPAAKAGPVELVGPPSGGADDMNLYPLLVGPGASPLSGEFFAPASAARAGAAVAPREGRTDGALDYRGAARSDLPDLPAASSAAAGLFVPALVNLRGGGSGGMTVRHAAELSSGSSAGGTAGGTADQSGSSGEQGNSGAAGAMVSVPLPTSIFLGPAGLVLAGYAARRFGRRR